MTTAPEILSNETRELCARERLAEALRARGSARENLTHAEAAEARAQALLQGAEDQLAGYKNAVERAAQEKARSLVEQVRQGRSALFTVPVSEEEGLLAKSHEAELEVNTYRRLKAEFENELANLQSTLQRAEAAVAEGVREVVSEESSKIVFELEASMRRAVELRHQLQALGSISHAGRRVTDFSHKAICLIDGNFPELQVSVRAKLVPTGNPKMPHSISQEPVWFDQQPAWHTFLRELEVDPHHAELKF